MRAGVSPATVSRVLNAHPGVPIAESTRERVRRAIEELGYHPNSIGRALVRRQSDTVGVVLPSTPESPLRGSFFTALLEGVLTAATDLNLDTIVFTNRKGNFRDQNLAKLRDGRCDGLLIFYQLPDNDVIPALLDAKRPIVLLNDRRDDERLSSVDVENRESAYVMTDYLLRQGHRRIAVLGFDDGHSYIRRRLDGYREALEAHNTPYDSSLVSLDQMVWQSETIANRVVYLMRLPVDRRPTAIFCLADDIAASVLSVLGRAGVRVPEDVSVAGFNDDGTAERQHPPLTTMRQPYEQIGICAIDLLLDQISDISCRGRKVTLPTELIVRASTGVPPSFP